MQEKKTNLANDIPTLLALDQQGFILGKKETLEQYHQRIAQFNSQTKKLLTRLDKEKDFEFETLPLSKEKLIDDETFQNSKKLTQKLYNFSLQRPIGFFDNLGLFFGGCTYIFQQSFFSLFFIRTSFKNRKKWLIYQRDEILAHESCHIARFALNSAIYEEYFAYQTSQSKFRRFFGSMLYHTHDTYTILAVFILTFCATIWETITPSPLFYLDKRLLMWFVLIVVISGYIIRHIYYLVLFKKAQNNISSISLHPKKILFRLSDKEILALAKEKQPLNNGQFKQFINQNSQAPQRSEILSHIL